MLSPVVRRAAPRERGVCLDQKEHRPIVAAHATAAGFRQRGARSARVTAPSSYATKIPAASPLLRRMANFQLGIDDVFQALADPTRCAIVSALGGGRRTISELAAPFDTALPSFIRICSGKPGH